MKGETGLEVGKARVKDGDAERCDFVRCHNEIVVGVVACLLIEARRN